MAKRTFAARTFAARTYKSGTWSGASSVSLENFLLYRLNPTVLLQTLPASPMSYDLEGELGLGGWNLGLSRRNKYGEISEKSQIDVDFDSGGNVVAAAHVPSNVRAIVQVSGGVTLVWDSVDLNGLTGPDRSAVQASPEDFQIAEAGDLATILSTVAAVAGQRRYRQDTGPFTHGGTVRLAVRSRGSGGTPVGEWAYAAAVVADTTGPLPAEIIT